MSVSLGHRCDVFTRALKLITDEGLSHSQKADYLQIPVAGKHKHSILLNQIKEQGSERDNKKEQALLKARNIGTCWEP